MPQDPIEQLLSQPPRIGKTNTPERSQTVLDRLANPKQYAPSQKLPYMTYDKLQETSEDMYEPHDFARVGDLIRSNVAKAIEARFPVVGERYTLKVENVHYETPKNTTLKAEKEILLDEGSLSDRLKGDWVLYDNATGKEVERKNATLLNVPRMTSRGTFIRNGSEIGLKNMFRLRSGVYTHIKGNGIVAAHINPEQTTGQQMSIEMEPSTGVMSIKRGTRTFGLLPMLRAAGMSEEDIQAAWGEQLYKVNYDKYAKLMIPNNSQFEEYKQVWDEGFKPIKLDAETTESTLGKGFSAMSPEVLLRASNRMLQVSHTMADADADDRDSLRYQRVMGPADYIPERIVRDGGGLLRKMFNTVDKNGTLDSISTGAFQPQVDSVFLDDKHAGYIDGASPMEALDFSNMVSRLGEGGIGSVEAAPAETRGVNDSYLGFVSPIRSPECVSADTEILTRDDGWKPISELSLGDFVAAYICGRSCYTDVLQMNVYDYDGEMIGYDDDVVSFLVTPDHRCVFTSGDSESFEPKIVYAKDWDIEKNNEVYVPLDSDAVGSWELNKDKYFRQHYTGKVYCPTVAGGLIVIRRNQASKGVVSGNSLKVGLDIYLTAGVMKGSNGKLYNRFRDKQGKSVVVPMDVTAKSIVATPELWDPQGDPEEFIPALVGSSGVDYVKRKDVDYFLENSNNMLSLGEGMIPLIGGIRSNRALMGCLHPDTLVTVIREGIVDRVSADELYNSFSNGSLKQACVFSLNEEQQNIVTKPIKGVYVHSMCDFDDKRMAQVRVPYTDDSELVTNVTLEHKWLVRENSTTEPELITTIEMYNRLQDSRDCLIPVADGSCLPHLDSAPHLSGWRKVSKVLIDTAEKFCCDYVIDIDVDDNVYMLANGMFTHNSKYANQAVSLPAREAPLVQRALRLSDGTETTTERYIGKQMGAKFSPVAGQVVAADADSITIKDTDGQKHTIDLYNEYPANQKGFIHNTLKVQVGDKVQPNQLLASSNYTDDSGAAALGTNLRVAFLTARNAGTFEDGITISESAAEKLKSEQLYKLRGDTTDDIEYSKSRYLSLFKDEFTAEQIAKISEDGLPKPGTVFNQGDPVYLGVQQRDIGVHGLHKQAAVPYVLRWEHTAPGTVTAVRKGRKHMTIYTKAYTPMEVGDKMCYDEETEVFTNFGWKFFKDLTGRERVLTLDTYTGDTWLAVYGDMYSYDYKGKMYSLKTKHLDICVTPEHEHVVSVNTSGEYIAKIEAKKAFGKPLYHLVDQNILLPHCYKCAQTPETKEEWIDYEGKVYCIVVPATHTLFVRRHGKTNWSGNSSRYGAKGVVSQILPDSEMPKDSEGRPFEVLQSPLGLPSRCYDKETEFLVLNKGWVKGSDVKEDDLLYCFDPTTMTGRFDRQLEPMYKKRYKGIMFGYQNRCTDFLVTPGHKVYARTDFKGSPYKETTIDSVYNKRYIFPAVCKMSMWPEKAEPFHLPVIPITGRDSYNTTDDIVYDAHDWAAFLGWYLSEGNTTYVNYRHRDDGRVLTSNYRVHIAQDATVHPEETAVIDALLTRMGLTYSYGKKNKQFHISGKRLAHYLKQFGNCYEKYIPDWLFTQPESVIDAFLDSIWLGDGTCYLDAQSKRGLYKSGKQTFVKSIKLASEKLIDQLQILFSMKGIKTVKTVTPPDKRHKGAHYLYRLGVSTRDAGVSTTRDRKGESAYPQWYTSEYNDMVYCPTVPTGYVLTRRNGRVICLGNTNTSMLVELQLAKIARKHGIQYNLPDFMEESVIDFTNRELQKYGMSPDEDLEDPVTGRTIPQVQTGELFFYKLKHMAELKERGRSTGTYSSEDVPLKGEGAARRLGSMEVSAVYSGGGAEVLRDAKMLRGQRNDQFWRDFRDGKYPDMPEIPLVHKKFFAHLQAAGVHLEDRGDRVHMYGTTQQDVEKLTGAREVKLPATFESKNMQPVDGGLFDPTIFGADGDQWGYATLPEPVLNPVMAKSIGAVLGWKDKELNEYLAGERALNGKFGTQHLMETLDKIDLKKELADSKEVLKSPGTTLEQRDLARKRLRAIEPMLREGKKPSDFFLTRMPILPPRFRPVTAMSNGVGIAADANFLYKRMMDAASDLKEAKAVLPEELQLDARKQLYSAVSAVTGLTPTDDPKLESKGVAGVLKWAFGKGSPKCYDPETEILTEKGWIKFPEYVASKHLNYDVAVATINPDSHDFEWQKPTLIFSKCYTGDMVHTKTSHLDMLVTADHMHYVSNRVGRGNNDRWSEWHKVEAGALVDKVRRTRIKVAAAHFHGTKPACDKFWCGDKNGFAAYIGFVAADGYVHQDGCSVIIDVVKERKISKLLAILDAVPLLRTTLSTYDRPSGSGKSTKPHTITRISVHSKELATWVAENVGKGALNKHLSREILEWDTEYLKSLWLGYFDGDGEHTTHTKQGDGETWVNRSRLTDNGGRVSTISRALIDSLMELGVKIGVQMVEGKPLVRDGYNTLYRLSAHGFPYTITEYKKHHTVVPYDGPVYCVTVPNGLIVTRRNGKPVVSGNCGSLHRKVFGANLDLGSLGTIVPDNSLTIDQVGIPEESAWKMFEPFVVRKLTTQGSSMTTALRAVMERTPEAKAALKTVMAERPVLLNRAPTLWRYGIQGQYGVLVEGNAIHVNPNICKVYNADFDGDSCLNSVKIAIFEEFFNSALDKSQNCAILSSRQPKEGGNVMLSKEAKVSLVNVRCAISDIPRIEESAVQIKENITEWDVPAGIFAEAIDRATGEKVMAPVTKLSLHKDIDMYDVHMATYGAYKHIVTCSKDDTLLTYKNGEIVITDASTAKGAVVPKERAADGGMDPDVCAKYIMLDKQYALSHKLGIFLGMMIGDGWVDSQDSTWVAAECKEIQDWLVTELNSDNSCIDTNKNAHVYEHDTKRFGNNKAHKVWCSLGRHVARALKDKIGAGAYNKRIPLECMAASKAHRLGILMGLIATDGSVNYNDNPASGKKSTQKSILFHTTSQLLRDNIIDLCFSLGIRATATGYKGENSLVTCYAVNLSVRDVAKLYKSESKFRMIANSDEAALKGIVRSIDADVKPDSYNIVPFPTHLSILLSIVNCGFLKPSDMSRYKNQGFISRDFAREFVTRLKEFNYSEYSENNRGSKSSRPGYTPEQVKALAEDWIRLVENEDVQWEVVTDVQPLGKMDGWDITVPGPLTFTLGSGTFVQDSMTTHVPVSKEAIQAIDKNMMPSRNLLSPNNYKAHFIPRSEFAQGLYLASRPPKEGEPTRRFRTKAEMLAALNKGEIKIDTPVVIG